MQVILLPTQVLTMVGPEHKGITLGTLLAFEFFTIADDGDRICQYDQYIRSGHSAASVGCNERQDGSKDLHSVHPSRYYA